MRSYAILSILLQLLLARTSFAQQDSLSDVFPLVLGNKWTYGFNTYYNAQSYQETDTGTAEYQIVGFNAYADSTRWQFVRRRTFTSMAAANPPGALPPQFFKDSLVIELVEKKRGQHELYCPVADPHDAFYPFAGCFSENFTRYATTDVAGNVTYTRNVTGQCFMAYTATEVLRKDTGVVHSQGHGYNIITQNLRYDLRGFSTSPQGPYLSCDKSMPWSTLVGIPKDTTITLTNMGTNILHLLGVSTSDGALIGSFASVDIPPFGGVSSLKLHYTSRVAGVATMKIIITSNSLSAPDTIIVRSTNRMSAATTYDTRHIDFGWVDIARRYEDFPIEITNVGNVGLSFDSTRSSPSWFALMTGRRTLEPDSTIVGTVRCTPTVSSLYVSVKGILLIYTNAATSPDTIHVACIPDGGILQFNRRSIDFGEVGVGRPRRATLNVSLVGAFDLRVQRNPGPGSEFLFPQACPPMLYAPYNTPNSFQDVVLFRPTALGRESSFVVYASSRDKISGPTIETISSSDTIWLAGTCIATSVHDTDMSATIPEEPFLRQNYPNPFNPGTTISFGIVEDAFVTLKIFNVLGQAVATLVNEPLGRGTYNKTFDGTDLASGVYLYRVEAGGFVQTRKLLLLR